MASAAAILGLAWGCSARDDSNATAAANGGGMGMGDSGLSDALFTSDGMSKPGDATHLNALCNTASPCVPDDFMACADFVPAVAGGSAGAAGNSAGGSASGTRGDAGAGGTSGATNGESGTGGDGSVVLPTVYGCQVQRTSDPKQPVLSQCALSGLGGNNAPCLTSSDCQAGYGCVGDQSSGLCERYCCQDADACDSGTYCADRPMRDAIVNAQAKGSGDTSTAPMIPVCVPALNCDLAEAYPCKGSSCVCTDGTACLVVRSNGTTTCAVPGAGKLGDACPCAWGFVCSATAQQCVQLCYTRDSAPCGASGKCQSVADLPDGWGVCVGN